MYLQPPNGHGYSGDVGFAIMLLITLTVYFSDHS